MPEQRRKDTGSVGEKRRSDGRIPVSIHKLIGKGRRIGYVRDEKDVEAKMRELYALELAELDLPTWIDAFVERWGAARGNDLERQAAINEWVEHWRRIAAAAAERTARGKQKNEVPDLLGLTAVNPNAPRAKSPLMLLDELLGVLGGVLDEPGKWPMPRADSMQVFQHWLPFYPEAKEVEAAVDRLHKALVVYEERSGLAALPRWQTASAATGVMPLEARAKAPRAAVTAALAQALKAMRACQQTVDRTVERLEPGHAARRAAKLDREAKNRTPR
ncbi:MAG: hypothetical protein JO198_03520 [Candidatus Dormibacteraeota bacterium]|nr:hypothetical protein [Candidatus Dormibacteraeota bacterium]